LGVDGRLLSCAVLSEAEVSHMDEMGGSKHDELFVKKPPASRCFGSVLFRRNNRLKNTGIVYRRSRINEGKTLADAGRGRNACFSPTVENGLQDLFPK